MNAWHYRVASCATAASLCSVSAFALDGRGGKCGVSLLEAMFNPMPILAAVIVTVIAGIAMAAWRAWRKQPAADPMSALATLRLPDAPTTGRTSPRFRVFSRAAMIAGLIAYVAVLVPTWYALNLCF